jgi:hypothetical protein
MHAYRLLSKRPLHVSAARRKTSSEYHHIGGDLGPRQGTSQKCSNVIRPMPRICTIDNHHVVEAHQTLPSIQPCLTSRTAPCASTVFHASTRIFIEAHLVDFPPPTASRFHNTRDMHIHHNDINHRRELYKCTLSSVIENGWQRMSRLSLYTNDIRAKARTDQMWRR